jgi:DNA processing protein
MKIENYVAMNALRFTDKKRFNMLYKSFLENNSIPSDLLNKEDFLFSKREIKKAEKLNIKIIPFDSPYYPELLKKISDFPIVLYVKGSIKSTDKLSISIVGSRRCTRYGQSVAKKFSEAFASLGITIVSGLALGIDSEAHIGAINGKGRTIAVIGSGLDRVYPASNKKLAEKIWNGFGSVISEFPFGTEPRPFNFPFRNRIISGLTYGTLVIEAAKKSGSLITARLAAEQGRDVFAVPGNITSKMSEGTNALIKDGAIPVTEPDDILSYISAFNGLFVKGKVVELSPDEQKIIESLENTSETVSGISRKTGITEQQLISILTYMEVKGLIKRNGGRYFKI